MKSIILAACILSIFCLSSASFAKDITWHDISATNTMSRKYYFLLGFLKGMSTYENIRHAELGAKTPFGDALDGIFMFEVEGVVDNFYRNNDKNMSVELTIMYALMQKYGVDITKYERKQPVERKQP